MRVRPPSPALVISCLALLLALGGTSFAAVSATGNAVNITDPGTAANKAKVDSSGKLQVAVNGTAGARPVAPATPWSTSAKVSTTERTLLAGPSASPIDMTSFSLSLFDNVPATDVAIVELQAYHVPGSAATCTDQTTDGVVWRIARLPASTPLAVSFPTPLQLKPPAGTKACLYAAVGINPIWINASGFIS
jgi:hypothetical protein